MDDSLRQLVTEGLISAESAYDKAMEKPSMKDELGQIDPSAAAGLADDDGAEL
jgi:hypothetical protein